MATEIGRLIAIFEADTSRFDAAKKRIEASMKSTAQTVATSQRNISSSVTNSQKSISQGELSMARQMQAVESLQRQRSRALVQQWREQERAALKAASGAKSFTGVMQELSTSVAALQGPLGGIAGRLSSITSLGTGAGPLTAVAVALAAIGGAAASLFALVNTTAQATGKFKDLSQQTGFAVETLSTLENAARKSGGSIETINAALGIFETNMVEAREKGSEMSRVFKQLGVDTSDHEKALRQALVALAGLRSEEERTTAARKLFGRSAREILAIIKDSGSNIDQLTETMRRNNTLITTESAAAADQLVDMMYDVGQQFAGVGRIIAGEFYPITQKTLAQIEQLLIGSLPTIRTWAGEFVNASRGVYELSRAVTTLGGVLTGLNNLPIPTILRILASASGLPGIIGGLAEIGRHPAGPSGIFDPANRADAFNRAADRATQTGKFSLGGGGKGGGGRKGDSPADVTRNFIETLNQEREALARQSMALGEYASGRSRTTDVTRESAVAVELLKKRYDSLSDAQRLSILQAAEEVTAQRKEASAFQAVADLIKRQSEAITEATISGDEWDRQIYKLVGTLRDAGIAISAEMLAVIKSNDAKLKAIALTKQMIELGRRAADSAKEIFGAGPAGSAGEFFDPRGSTEEEFNRNLARAIEERMGGETAPRDLGPIRERMKAIAAEATDVIANALRDGFEKGMKAGLVSFAQGILNMIQSAALQALERRLADIFTGIFSGGGGKGNVVTKILGSIIGGGLGAGAAGASTGSAFGSFAGRFAEGGIVPGVDKGHDSVLAMLRPGEMVLNKQQQRSIGGNRTTIINVTVPRTRGETFRQKRSKRELAETIAGLIAA